MELHIRVNVELDKPANYLIMGWWSNTMSYKLSDAGIPVVKVADSTAAGFSVYALNVEAATVGASPAGAGASQWKLIESAEFIYMQDAYIERLQAAIVTAERIEALEIRTSRLEVLQGAKVGGFDIGQSYIGAGSQWDESASGMSLWEDFIVFNAPDRQALIGATSSLGFDFLGRFSDTAESGYMSKLGVSFDIRGSDVNNTAIALTAGNISGLTVRTRRTGTSTTLTRSDVFLSCYMQNNSSSVTMPAEPEIGELKILYNINNMSILVKAPGKKFKAGTTTFDEQFSFGGDNGLTQNLMFLWDGQFWILMSI